VFTTTMDRLTLTLAEVTLERRETDAAMSDSSPRGFREHHLSEAIRHVALPSCRRSPSDLFCNFSACGE
jgi:hypothetical protein